MRVFFFKKWEIKIHRSGEKATFQHWGNVLDLAVIQIWVQNKFSVLGGLEGQRCCDCPGAGFSRGVAGKVEVRDLKTVVMLRKAFH